MRNLCYQLIFAHYIIYVAPYAPICNISVFLSVIVSPSDFAYALSEIHRVRIFYELIAGSISSISLTADTSASALFACVIECLLCLTALPALAATHGTSALTNKRTI